MKLYKVGPEEFVPERNVPQNELGACPEDDKDHDKSKQDDVELMLQGDTDNWPIGA